MRKTILGALLGSALVLGGCSVVEERNEAADRAAIHELLVDYGRTLDSRDFDGFSALFAEGGTYGQVPGEEAGEMMRQVFAENAQGFAEPNFHIFFNEVITLDGLDAAQADSMSFYMVPGEDGRPVAAMMARYTDEIVREDDVWKFKSRQVQSLMPAPPTG